MKKIIAPSPAIDFEATRVDGGTFRLSSYRGKRILLSFFRNGACALCNLRVHEMIQNWPAFVSAGIEVVAVFESSAEDMLPYVARQMPPFPLLADATGVLYDKYGVENSPEKVNEVISSGSAKERIVAAAEAGFKLTHQQGSNFFRLPADFLIDENFIIQRSHYSNQVVDHIDLESVLMTTQESSNK
jgi:peroxiredoxin